MVEVESAPKIVVVDVFDGGLWVHPGKPGTVSVTVEPYSSCKNGSTAEAEAAAKEVEVALTREADAIQIVAKRVAQSATRCFVSTSTHLYIPPGSSVWLRTTTGSILVLGSPSEVVMENQIGAFGADFTVAAAGESRLVRVPGARLEVVGGSVYAGNRSYGKVLPGDRVQFTGDGKLTVNGALRTARESRN